MAIAITFNTQYLEIIKVYLCQILKGLCVFEGTKSWKVCKKETWVKVQYLSPQAAAQNYQFWVYETTMATIWTNQIQSCFKGWGNMEMFLNEHIWVFASKQRNMYISKNFNSILAIKLSCILHNTWCSRVLICECSKVICQTETHCKNPFVVIDF